MEVCKEIERLEKLENDTQSFKDDLLKIKESLHTLLGRNNDFIIKVINGKTEERLASELIGEIYVELKHIKDKTTDASVKRLKEKIKDGVNVFTLVILIVTLIKVWFDK